VNPTLETISHAFAGTTLAADIPLAVMTVQALVLAAVAPRGARAASLAAALLAAAPGAALVLSLRAALAGGQEIWILVWLAASYPLHVIDLARRPLAAAPRQDTGNQETRPAGAGRLRAKARLRAFQS
jgi:hypothetical protein